MQIKALIRPKHRPIGSNTMKNAVTVVNFFHRIIEIIATGFFFLVGKIANREFLPTIDDDILKLSASTLAHKIRAREVRNLFLLKQKDSNTL